MTLREKLMMSEQDRTLRVNTAEVTGKVIDGEGLIINLATSIYYSNGRGRRGGLVADRTGYPVAKIATILAGRYQKAEEEVRADIDRLGAELLREGLVVHAPVKAPSESSATLPPAAGRPYAPPQLLAYRDMQDLLALDPRSRDS